MVRLRTFRGPAGSDLPRQGAHWGLPALGVYWPREYHGCRLAAVERGSNPYQHFFGPPGGMRHGAGADTGNSNPGTHRTERPARPLLAGGPPEPPGSASEYQPPSARFGPVGWRRGLFP